jgi:hypothetical protein
MIANRHGPALVLGAFERGRAGHRTPGNGDPNNQPGFFALVPLFQRHFYSASFAAARSATRARRAGDSTTARSNSARVIGGNQLRFQRVAFVLRFPDVMLHWEFARMGRNWTPSIVPSGHDQTFYIIVNNYGELGPAFAETDLGEAYLETTISDLMSGQYSDPIRVVAFNTSEHWSEDASEDVAREIAAP